MAKRPVPKYDFKAFGAAFKVLFHVKGVLRVCVGQVLVFRVLRYVEFVRKERAHPA